MSELKSYLASKYMSGPKADAILSRTGPPKKKKRKVEPQRPLANLRDEDGGWGMEEKDEDGDDLAEAMVASDRGFKKRRTVTTEVEQGLGWATIREGVVREESPADERPLVVEEEETRSQKPFAGGLVTASELKKNVAKKDVTPTVSAEEIARAQETVYRDSSGKRIDMKAARAEAARLKREKEEKEARKMEWGKGVVQREEQERRRVDLERQKERPFARHADDADLNEEQKAKELWNDPAAAFLTVGRRLLFSFTPDSILSEIEI